MFKVTPIPAFNDNYIWLIHKPGYGSAVVDPGDADPVIRFLESHDLTLDAILITHHHADHTGGVQKLLSRYQVPVYGPHNSPFDGITHPLASGDTLDLFGEQLEIQAVPAHTLDHISYFKPEGQPQLFCGDTLFMAGCGRLFEGTAAQMFKAMSYFSSLPDNTEVYCTHEYTLSNLAFAQAVEPDNAMIAATIERCRELRARQEPTLPSRIDQERNINPFMRTSQISVRSAAETHEGQPLTSEVEVLASLREWKNHF
ncbi:hydroxyacylglutathione hydrolase [Nitrincola alkalilacustris]|uniref:hydroxyacylglutathione hydrolase n=1 Tax=Nitrincola alkalilacustris TaxID=1571224 RepID=UPI00124F01AB|nr:hydroxyacylglutathione hydrolase [Nitrincola alkalilacustris]